MTVISDLEVDSARLVVRRKKYDGAGHSEGLTHRRPRPHRRYWVANLLVPTSMVWQRASVEVLMVA